MLSKKEQLMLLKMWYESDHRQRTFFRKELLDFGLFKTESGLSRAMTNLYHHLVVDIIHREKLSIVLPETIQFKAERKMGYSDNIKRIEDAKLEVIKEITKVKRGYKRAEPRIKYAVTEEGELLARMLIKAEKWKRDSRAMNKDQ